ncbi:S8 family serine peptidase [Gammaproteobacteria bacterium AB-CW1]|uniref:S8 family serine peptidase n=1 Tax=Natronospira elongata TaxID=3110268 RepID=A0AAP6JHE7_9GAMM|nr:S8 family serine peptidase [Gammaproteobacteria bacterium AB-CW1]
MRPYILAILLSLVIVFPVQAQPSLDPVLEAEAAAAPLALHEMVISFEDDVGQQTLDSLVMAGVTAGVVLNELPMVLVQATGLQLSQLQNLPGVVSIYGNRIHQPYTNASRAFIGLEALIRDRDVQTANMGLPVSGQGIGVAVVDTGVDATHSDLRLGENVVQNVYFPLADVPLNFPSELVPPIAVEDSPHTDIEGGHGTFVAGVTGGTGAASAGFYAGVAPGADLIGLNAGNDAGLSTFAIVQTYDWILANQDVYNIRVVNNSFGSDLGEADNYDPYDPINVGTRMMNDQHIAVVFAAGNSGDAPGAINRLAVAPWVISVAAGQKEGLGSPAGFSSRGMDNGSDREAAPHPADPEQAPNLRPDITAPGVNIKSVRSKGAGLTNLAGTALLQDTDIPPGFLPFYTTSQGTSFAAPHVAGVIALMLEANPALTPEEIMLILRGSANPMPFEERVVGAGYVDAHNAVREAIGLSAVSPAFDLMPGPDTPEIVDVRGDQTGTQAQDILSGRFYYDADANALVYTLEVADLDERTPNNRWTMSSFFSDTELFVTASINELGQAEYAYGRFTVLDTGTRNQETIGEADDGQMTGNRIVIRLGLEKINEAVGFDVFDTVSTGTQANSQILIGTSFTGGLLLNADSASGRDFRVGELGDNGDGNGDDDADNGEGTACPEQGIRERLPGVYREGDSGKSIAFSLACEELKVQLTYNPGNQDLAYELRNSDGDTVAHPTHGNGRRLTVDDLPPGDYELHLSGDTGTDVDFVFAVHQD